MGLMKPRALGAAALAHFFQTTGEPVVLALPGDHPHTVPGGEPVSQYFHADPASEPEYHRAAGCVCTRRPPPARLLDIGCGPGRFLRAFAELGYEAVGELDSRLRTTSSVSGRWYRCARAISCCRRWRKYVLEYTPVTESHRSRRWPPAEFATSGSSCGCSGTPTPYAREDSRTSRCVRASSSTCVPPSRKKSQPERVYASSITLGCTVCGTRATSGI